MAVSYLIEDKTKYNLKANTGRPGIYISAFTDTERAAYLRTFSAVPATQEINPQRIDCLTTILNGYVFIDAEGALIQNVPKPDYNLVSRVFQDNTRNYNSSFYKSFATTIEKDATGERFIDQILNYFTRYGLNLPAYIPIGELDLPEFKGSTLKARVIKIVPPVKAIENLNDYLANSLRAPSPFVLDDIKLLLGKVTLRISEVLSFEVKCILCDYRGLAPEDPTDCLRYIIYKLTGSTLIIKNKEVINGLKYETYSSRTRWNTDKLFNVERALKDIPIEQWATIFFQKKPLFLALKSHPGCASIINKIRREAEFYNVPQNLTNSIKGVTQMTLEDFDKFLRKIDSINVSNRDLIKVINALEAQKAEGPQVYSIRNTKTFIKDISLVPQNLHQYKIEKLSQVLIERLTPLLSGKLFYKPRHIEYAAPTSEKQMLGNIPYGSYVTSSDNAKVIGIHWNDGAERTDLDFHLNSPGGSFGWNSSWSGEDNDPVYSGDMTSAPAPYGAAESFFIPDLEEKTYIATVQKFSGEPRDDKFDFFMTEEPDNQKGRGHKYTYDPNFNLFPSIAVKLQNDQMTLGYLTDTGFTFFGGALSNGNVPRGNYEDYIAGIKNKLESQTFLSILLYYCDAIVYNDLDDIPEELQDQVIDLSPNALAADTLFKIVDGTI
jgi:hypothetical protein